MARHKPDRFDRQTECIVLQKDFHANIQSSTLSHHFSLSTFGVLMAKSFRLSAADRNLFEVQSHTLTQLLVAPA